MKDFFKNLSKKQIIIMISVAVVLIIGIIVTLVLVLGKDEPKKKLEPPKTEEKDDVNEKKEVEIVDLESNVRPYAVMINNLNEARAVQSGLPEAFLVYEIVAEGGITRFLALFEASKELKIGSIRSARHYYLDYALENDAVYVHWGWSPQAQTDIYSLGINNINGMADAGFFRENPLGLSSEHTGFTTIDNLNEVRNNKGIRSELKNGYLLDYSAESVELPEEAADVSTVTIKYSNYMTVGYEYDEETGLYKRTANNKAHLDYPTGEQLTAKNIIVYEVTNYTIAGDTAGRQNLENIGSGEGYYITEGKAIKINWSKKARASKTEYTYEDGTEITVNDGNTYIQIVPTNGKITME